MAEAAKVVTSADDAESNSSDADESITADSEWQTASEEEEAADALYQFKITLKHTKPLIWRRILVLNTSTFAELHAAVVSAMGWLDTHLHAFRGRGLEIAPAEEEVRSAVLQFMLLLSGGGTRKPKKIDETKVKVWEYFKKPKDSITYLYDFGDEWLHSIVLEKILPHDNRSYPICVAGKRACPPDDCGGVHGYENLLKILSNRNDPEYQSMKEWMSFMGKEDFDPEAFDPDSAIIL